MHAAGPGVKDLVTIPCEDHLPKHQRLEAQPRGDVDHARATGPDNLGTQSRYERPWPIDSEEDARLFSSITTRNKSSWRSPVWPFKLLQLVVLNGESYYQT